MLGKVGVWYGLDGINAGNVMAIYWWEYSSMSFSWGVHHSIIRV